MTTGNQRAYLMQHCVHNFFFIVKRVWCMFRAQPQQNLLAAVDIYLRISSE